MKYKQPYSLYKRGKYYYYRTYDDKGNRTTAKSTGKKTKYEAREFCDSLYLSNNLVKNEILFKTFAAGFYDPEGLYFKDRAAPAANNTIKQYKSLLINYIMPYFENIKVIDIDYLKLKTFRIYLAERLAPASVVSVMGALGRILVSAYRNDIIKNNPFDKLESYNADKGQRDAFTLDEVKTIYKNISDEYKPVILTIALCGLRISEFLGLSPDTIQEEKNIYYLNLTRQRCKGNYIPLKRNSVRVIPVIDYIKNYVLSLNNNWKFEYYINKEFHKVKDIYFKNTDRELTIHSLRHFFITNTKSCGVIESKVEYIAGHKLKGVKGIYTNYKINDLTELLDWQEKTLKYIKG